MQAVELLESIKTDWLNRLTRTLARGSGLRAGLRDQLENFFNRLQQSLESGDPSWLDTTLSLWSESLTTSDLESDTSRPTQFVREIMLGTFETCQQALPPEQAIILVNALGPHFAHCFETAVSFEITARTGYLNRELENARQTLVRLDRSKSDFVSVAAHELKTPLTLVEGYSAMLSDSLSSQTDPTNIAMLDGIHSGTRRLKAIIDDMIDVTLIDNHLMTLNYQPVWINRLVMVLQHELKKSFTDRHQTLTVLPFAGSDELFFGDPERLLQVLRNLLMNAIKFTPDGGEITVDGRKLPGIVEVLIKDTGIGISVDDQAIIFEKFTHVGDVALHSSGRTKFKGGGPGLGLYIARGIIEAHGGAIWAESPGCDEQACPGSIFHVLIPQRDTSPDARLTGILNTLEKSR